MAVSGLDAVRGASGFDAVPSASFLDPVPHRKGLTPFADVGPSPEAIAPTTHPLFSA